MVNTRVTNLALKWPNWASSQAAVGQLDLGEKFAGHSTCEFVIASEAKQSIAPQADRWIARLRARRFGGLPTLRSLRSKRRRVVASLLAMTARQSTFTLAALMIGHQRAISAFCHSPSACGVSLSFGGI